MNNSIIKINQNGTYSDPALEGKILSQHNEYLENSKQFGATCAIQNSINDETVLPVLTETIYRNYDDLNAECHQKLDGTLGIAQAKLQIDTICDEISELRSQEEVCFKNFQLEKNKVGQVTIPKVPYKQILLGVFLGLFVLAFDTYFLGSAFQLTGSSFGISLIIGLAISFTIAIVSILGTIYVERFTEKWKRFLGYLILSILISAGIMIICEMREEFIKIQSGHELPAWKMMLLNTLAFVAFHLIYKFILAPAIEVIKKRKEALLKLQNLKRLKEKLDNVKSQISSKIDSINQIKHFRLSVLSYAKATENKVSKLYRQSISEFKKSYILQNGNVPKCFATEAPDLSSYYSEYEITSKVHESHEN